MSQEKQHTSVAYSLLEMKTVYARNTCIYSHRSLYRILIGTCIRPPQRSWFSQTIEGNFWRIEYQRVHALSTTQTTAFEKKLRINVFQFRQLLWRFDFAYKFWKRSFNLSLMMFKKVKFICCSQSVQLGGTYTMQIPYTVNILFVGCFLS